MALFRSKWNLKAKGTVLKHLFVKNQLHILENTTADICLHQQKHV